ncbi:MAG: hypothetical protein WC208_06420 [Gallionella sp.]|jgi:tetratricopeptide (TPR) repeat protein
MSSLFVKSWQICGSVLLLAACSHVPEKRSPIEIQAAQMSLSAEAAFARGQYSLAKEGYLSAYRADMAVENIDGMAINLLNLARVSDVMGEYVNTQSYLGALLDKPLHVFKPEYLAQAETQRALLSFRNKDFAATDFWLDHAQANCLASCRVAGVILNVRAMLALQEKNAADALRYSREALDKTKRDFPEEYANALRISAEAHMLEHHFDVALPILEEVLALDKSLGLPRKIQLDLLRLAQAWEGRGGHEQAENLRARAHQVELSVQRQP